MPGPANRGPLGGVTTATASDHRPTAETRLTALYTEHAPALLARLTGFTDGDRHQAEDLLQETMLRAWRGVGSLPSDPLHARRWLFTIARHVAVDAVRRRRRRPVEVSDAEALSAVAASPADDITDTVIAVDAMRRAFGALSTDQRTVVAELFLAGRSPAEAAQRLGVPVGTVKSRAHYAMRMLHKSLDVHHLDAHHEARGSRERRRAA
ncbi:MAG: sigma-70 family RNA polymerase sigma factor [Catenulispora sp.]|nr:sigma-70 family RNA polymerase sigma factor [Catenulispora sp.]